MTISFIPGEINQSKESLSQAQWRNHNIAVYGSGNNLIITSITHNSNGSSSKNLQTVYLNADPNSISVNDQNGLIAVGIQNTIVVYKPLNEYMSVPRWEEALQIDTGNTEGIQGTHNSHSHGQDSQSSHSQDSQLGHVTSLDWANHEDELVVGTKTGLLLYHITEEFSSQLRWSCTTQNVSRARITHSGNKIVSYGPFDRLAKVWSRINYGDENTLFEMAYLTHPRGEFVTDVFMKSRAKVENSHSDEDESDVIYTVTNLKVRIWASYEFNGHAHLRCWKEMSLTELAVIKKKEVPGFNYSFGTPKLEDIQDYNPTPKGNHRSVLSEAKDVEIAGTFLVECSQINQNYDLFVIILKSGNYITHKISNIHHSPPNSVKFEAVNLLRFEKYAFPSHLPVSILPTDINSDAYLIDYLSPIYVSSPIAFLDKLIIMIHDRTKNTIRCDLVEWGRPSLSGVRTRSVVLNGDVVARRKSSVGLERRSSDLSRGSRDSSRGSFGSPSRRKSSFGSTEISPPAPSKIFHSLSRSFNKLSGIVSPVPESPKPEAAGTKHVKFPDEDELKIDLHKFDLPKRDTSELNITLLNKYQGHTKSIRKLVKSTLGSVLLSLSNFGQFNYLWKPYHINTENDILLNKICIIDTSKGELAEPIQNSIVLDDGHLVIVLTKDELAVFDTLSYVASRVGSLPGVYEEALAFVIGGEEEIKREKTRQGCGITGTPGIHDTNGGGNTTYTITAVFSDVVKTWEMSHNMARKTPSRDEHSLGKSTREYVLVETSTTATPFTDTFNAASRSASATPQIPSAASSSTPGHATPQTPPGHATPQTPPSHATPPSCLINTYQNQISTIDSAGTFTIYNQSLTKLSELAILSTDTSLFQFTRNKVALVNRNGYNLVIWDLQSGGLEYEELFPNKISFLKWNFLKGNNCILSVAFSNQIYQYIQLRYDYTNRVPNYARIKQLDLEQYTSHNIGGIAWIDGFMVVGCGNQFFIDDKWVELGEGKGSFIDSTIRQVMVGYAKTSQGGDQDDGAGYKTLESDMSFDINYLVRVLNGPLPVYHPQFLIQCLFLNQLELVKVILVRLFRTLKNGQDIVWDLLIDVMGELTRTGSSGSKHNSPGPDSFSGERSSNSKWGNFGTSPPGASSLGIETFATFTPELGAILIDYLQKQTLPLITRNQQSTLISTIYIVRDLLKYVSLLDENAVRFLIAFKLYQMSPKQHHLSMRDINWAVHSDNRDMLVSIIEETYGVHKLRWEHIKNLRMMYWVDSEKFTQLIERVCQNEYADSRDPSGMTSLFYVALKKKQILIELWKLGTTSEKEKIIKFLRNDFSDKRWSLAAKKNAYVLLGKHRFMDAAYFFLLAGSVNDCCSILYQKVDVQLAVTVAKLFDVDYLRELAETKLATAAIERNDRWTVSWIFWQQDLKELAVQALICRPQEMFPDVDATPSVDHFLMDDPLLVVLFGDLRSRKIHYFEGARKVDKQREFEFVVKVCGIYSRMGCDYLAILLLRTWRFEEGKREVVSVEKKEARVAPPVDEFEEPDMSAFDFGF